MMEKNKSQRETREVKLRPCSVMGDFNVTDSGEKANFYAPSFGNIDRLAPTLLCHDEKISMSPSNADEGVLNQLRIMFESCDTSWYRQGPCKSHQEINHWIKDKQIVTVINE